jgi:hypothetical protein
MEVLGLDLVFLDPVHPDYWRVTPTTEGKLHRYCFVFDQYG